MRCISVRQPWAWCIVNGYKPVENRTWSATWRGPILIHAGKEVDLESMRVVRRLLADAGEDPLAVPMAITLPVGGIVGRADLVDCVTRHPSPWFFGPFGFVLSNARPLDLVKCRGQLGLFEVDEAALGIASPKVAGQEEMFG